MGRDGDAAERHDPFGGLRDGKVPRDEIADSVPEDVAGLRRDFDRGDHEEAAARRRLRHPDSTDRVVVRDRDSREAHPLGDRDESAGVDSGVRRVLRVIVKVQEHRGGRTSEPVRLRLARWDSRGVFIDYCLYEEPCQSRPGSACCTTAYLRTGESTRSVAAGMGST